MSIAPNRVDEKRIKLDLTGAGFLLEHAWNEMLDRVKAANSNLKGQSYFIVDLIVPKGHLIQGEDFKMNLGVIVRKEDLYAVGLVKDTNNYIEIADIEYGSYNRITKKEKKLSVTVNNIADNVKTLDMFITSFDEKTNNKLYFREESGCIAFTNIAFLISEAARFEFVRDTVKRIYGYLSNDEILQIYLNTELSDCFYNYRPYYRDLLDHYSKILKQTSEKNVNIHTKMLTVAECREYYSDTVKFPDDYPNLDDLRKIGLIERK